MPRPQRDSYGSVPKKKPTPSGHPSKSSAREGRTPRRTSGPSRSPPPNLHLQAKSPLRGSQVQLSSSISNLVVPELPVPDCTCEEINGYFAQLLFQEQEDDRRRKEQEDDRRRKELAEATADEESNDFTLTRGSDSSVSSVGSAA